MIRRLFLAAVMTLPLLGGCLAKTVVDVATLPVRAGAKAVDWTTTSQSESDRNYGRKMRKQEERDGRDRRKAEQECRKQGGENCARYRDKDAR